MPGQRRKISYHRELYVVRKRISRIMKGKGSGKRKGKRSAGVPIVDLSCCKYELLRIVLRKNGWEESGDDEKNSHLIWTDMSIGPERLMVLKRGQKINHFFGMLQICRKKSLAQNLSTMRKMFPSQYKFFPRSFILPNQLPELLSKFNVQKVKTFILKPDNGCQGRGVALAQSGSDVRAAIEGLSGSNLLAQKYLANPMLINGYKFDLRIYVLILSCDPLRLYLYREGIVRFCTEKYSKPDPKNLALNCMHLTNYAVNKHNGKFEFNTNADETDKGHKWTLTSLFSALASQGHDTLKLHRQISQLVVMTLIAINPLLVHNYEAYLPEDESGRTCFELLGMDVLLDEKCKPWLLEVNHSPSFSIDTPLDMTVKEALLTDTLRLVHMDPSGMMKMRKEEKRGALCRLYGKGYSGNENSGCPLSQTLSVRKEDPFDEFEKANRGKYDRIYPSDDKNLNELYRIFLAGSEAAFKHSFHMRIKDTIVRVREERRQEEQAKEAEERRKVKARCEMRRKAQRSARLAALAARARLVEKLTAKMQDEIHSIVPVCGAFKPATPFETAHVPPTEVTIAHRSTVVQPVARPDLTGRTSVASNGTTKSYMYSEVKLWRPDSKLCSIKGDVERAEPTSDALIRLRSNPKPQALNPFRDSGADGQLWNAFFTKPLKTINARQLVARSKFLKDHYNVKKLPGALTAPTATQPDRGSESHCTLLQRYQGKLPALSKTCNNVRVTNVSIPASLAQLGSTYRYFVKSMPGDLQAQVAAKQPNATDIMRAQFGLPKFCKWKPSSENSNGSLGTRASFSPPTRRSPLRMLDSTYRDGKYKVEKRKKAPHGVDNLFRERKTFSWLRSPM